jgi:hypothetical protein
MMETNSHAKLPETRPLKNQSTIMTLIRPKGIALPQPAPRYKRIKKKADYLVEVPGIKRSRSAGINPPRNIHTPDWRDTTSDSALAVGLGMFDIVAAHRALEIYKSRIQREEEPRTALACQGARTGSCCRRGSANWVSGS